MQKITYDTISDQLIDTCRKNLDEMAELIRILGNARFIEPLDLFDGSTIGQHVRHILEFYLCLISGASSGEVNYDLRKRDHKIETDSRYANYITDKIKSNIKIPAINSKLRFSANYSNEEGRHTYAETTYGRELSSCLEHAIHHQALIKIAIKQFGMSSLLSPEFGIAPSTLRARSCVR